jgi:hypothetical protein
VGRTQGEDRKEDLGALKRAPFLHCAGAERILVGGVCWRLLAQHVNEPDWSHPAFRQEVMSVNSVTISASLCIRLE